MKSKSNEKEATVFNVSNSTASDWIDKQELMQKFPISSRTLQYYRSKNLIPFARLGGKVFYYLHGFLRVLERSASCQIIGAKLPAFVLFLCMSA